MIYFKFFSKLCNDEEKEITRKSFSMFIKEKKAWFRVEIWLFLCIFQSVIKILNPIFFADGIRIRGRNIRQKILIFFRFVLIKIRDELRERLEKKVKDYQEMHFDGGGYHAKLQC